VGAGALSTLVIRGELSDLLSRETAERMKTSGPRAQVVEIPASAMHRRSCNRTRSRSSANFLLGGR